MSLHGIVRRPFYTLFLCVFSYSLIICYPCGGAALNSNPNNCLLLFDCMIFRGLCYFFYALCQRRKCLQIFLYFAFMHERKLPWKIEKKTDYSIWIFHFCFAVCSWIQFINTENSVQLLDMFEFVNKTECVKLFDRKTKNMATFYSRI